MGIMEPDIIATAKPGGCVMPALRYHHREISADDVPEPAPLRRPPVAAHWLAPRRSPPSTSLFATGCGRARRRRALILWRK
jgi:hypothetical protein